MSCFAASSGHELSPQASSKSISARKAVRDRVVTLSPSDTASSIASSTGIPTLGWLKHMEIINMFFIRFRRASCCLEAGRHEPSCCQAVYHWYCSLRQANAGVEQHQDQVDQPGATRNELKRCKKDEKGSKKASRMQPTKMLSALFMFQMSCDAQLGLAKRNGPRLTLRCPRGRCKRPRRHVKEVREGRAARA